MEFHQRLCSLRMRNGLKQSELAKELAVSKSTISAYEKNKVTPSIDIAILLADYFEVSLDYLLCRTAYPKTLTANDAQTLALIKGKDRLELTKSIMDLISEYEIIKKI